MGNKKFFQRGLTQPEIMAASMVLILAILGTVAAFNSTVLMVRNNHETVIAMNIARWQLSTLEQYNAEFGLDSVYEFFKTATFTVNDIEKDDNTQIRAFLSTADYAPLGTFEFPNSNSGNEFDETIIDPDWGMPRDLNGDTDAVDKTVTSSELELLPVRIVVRWKGHNGPKTYKIATILYKVKK